MWIVSENEPITIAGGATFSRGLLMESLERAPVVYAADGGANLCMQYGCQPEKVIGDLDSIAADVRNNLSENQIIHVAEQDTTDFEKLLNRVDAPIMLAVGFLGDRIDHQMAVQTHLIAYAHKKVICIGEQDIIFVSPPRIVLPLKKDTRVSLYPMAQMRVDSLGLFWSTNDLNFAPDGQIGTSNKATGTVTLVPDTSRLLVILPRRCLDIAICALKDAAQWDAPI